MAAPKLTRLGLWNDANNWNEARAYRHPHTGVKYPSVTSILKMVDKSGLAQWSADLSMEWAVVNWSLLGMRSTEDAMRAGRYRWKDVRDERAQVGTGVHETIEAEHTDSWEFPVLDDEQKRIMEHWYMLNQEHKIEPMLSEFTVFNEYGGYAGTADGLWLIDGITTLVDIKTSKNMWPEHNYQLAALWEAPNWLIETSDMVWEDQPRGDIEKVAIIHLREDKHEIHYIEDLDLNYQVFRAYADVWRGKEALKESVKKREKASYADF